MIRRLTAADLPAALALSDAAGWNQTEEDWRRLLRLAPDGCWAVEAGGEVVSSLTAVVYEGTVAWIGMVLTAPAHRGQGYARRLLEHALDDMDRRGVGCVQLDATDMGRPLYAQYGFRDEYAVERWARPAGAVSAEPGELVRASAPWPDAFGADRGWLLSDLAGESAAVENGFAMWRNGRRAAYFGPCVVDSREQAERLLTGFLARYGSQESVWDLAPRHPEAAELARAYGFGLRRRLCRMRRGAGPCTWSARVWALAGFEWG